MAISDFETWFAANRNYFSVATNGGTEEEMRDMARQAYNIALEVDRNPNAYTKRKGSGGKKKKKNPYGFD